MKPPKNKANSYLIRVLMLIMISMFPYIAMADDDPGPCPDCPIDGGLIVLLVVGAVYGLKKYRDGNKSRMASLPGKISPAE